MDEPGQIEIAADSSRIIELNTNSKKTESVDLLTTPARVSGLAKGWNYIRLHLLVIALYGLFAVLFTWPLVLNLTGQNLNHYPYVIDRVFDRDQNLWNMWWLKKALLDFQINPFQTNYLFYPYGTNLYLHTFSPFNGLLALPFYGWLGWLGAYNVVNLIILVWCGYSAFLLADYLVKEKRAAFVAGFFFTFSPQHLFNLLGAQLNVITLQFLVLYLLFLIKLDCEKLGGTNSFKPSRRWLVYSVLAAVCLVLSSVSDQYLLIYSLLITALYYLARFIALRNWREIGGLLARTLPAQLLAGIILAPFLLATWRAINSGQFAKIENEAVPSDLVALFLPPVNNILVGAQGSTWGRNFFIQPDPRGMSIGLFGLAIALLGIARERQARWWGLLLLIALVLALGSYPSLRGQALDIPLPGRWLNELPILKVMRYSKRWLGPASLAIAICAAYFVAGTFRRFKGKRIELKRWGLVIALLVLFTLEVEPWPIPMSSGEYDLPRAYANNILPKTDSRPLLELPLRQKYTIKAAEMYYQTAHERPILWGYLSRIYKLNYNDTPLAYFVDGYNPQARDFITVQPEQLRGVLDYYNFGYVVIYKFQLDPAAVESWRGVLDQLTGGKSNLFYEDDQLIFYRLPDFKSSQEVGAVTLLRGSGWGGVEKRDANFYYRWIDGAEATLPFLAPRTTGNRPAYKLSFEAVAYYRDRTVGVYLNDQLISTLKILPAPMQYEVLVEGNLMKEGDNLLSLRPIEPADKPSEREKSSDTRSLTVLVGAIQWTRQ